MRWLLPCKAGDLPLLNPLSMATAEHECGGSLQGRSSPALPMMETGGLSAGEGHLCTQAALLLSQRDMLRDGNNHGNNSW